MAVLTGPMDAAPTLTRQTAPVIVQTHIAAGGARSAGAGVTISVSGEASFFSSFLAPLIAALGKMAWGRFLTPEETSHRSSLRVEGAPDYLGSTWMIATVM